MIIKLTYRVGLFLVFLLVVLIGLGVHTTSQPSFCGTCHEMNVPYLQSWKESIHANDATCVSCHVGKGLLPLLKAKTTRSFHDIYAHFISGFETPIRQTNPVKDHICIECHENTSFTLNDEKVQHNLHINESVTCITCHIQTAHVSAEQAAALASDPSRCENCHEAHVESPLIGSHSVLECGECHNKIGFTVKPQSCDNCHEMPDYHVEDFSRNCNSCHDEQSWIPALFENHIFPLNHESKTSLSCDTCHPDDYRTYTCYLCHEHGEAEVKYKHIEEGIVDYQDCISCHPTGREDEED